MTTLDPAEDAARRGVDVSVTGTDLRLYLRYAECDGNEVVCYRDGEPVQYAIEGRTYGSGHADVPAAPASARAQLDEAVRRAGAQVITMLAPQVDDAVRTAPISSSTTS